MTTHIVRTHRDDRLFIIGQNIDEYTAEKLTTPFLEGVWEHFKKYGTMLAYLSF